MLAQLHPSDNCVILSNAGRTVDCRKSKNTLYKFIASDTLEVTGNSNVCLLISYSLSFQGLEQRASVEKVVKL